MSKILKFSKFSMIYLNSYVITVHYICNEMVDTKQASDPRLWAKREKHETFSRNDKNFFRLLR